MSFLSRERTVRDTPADVDAALVGWRNLALRMLTMENAHSTADTVALEQISECEDWLCILLHVNVTLDLLEHGVRMAMRLRCGCAGRVQGLILRIKDANGLVQTGYFEDVPVMLAQSIREKTLLLAVDPNEERDQQPNATAVHVLHLGEVQDDGARTRGAGPGVRVHERILGKSGDVALHVDDADGVVEDRKSVV